MRITFPSISAAGRASRLTITEARDIIRGWAAFARNSPKSAVSLLSQLEAWMKLQYPTRAPVYSTIKITVPITGTYTNGITFTVANGVITAGVLS